MIGANTTTTNRGIGANTTTTNRGIGANTTTTTTNRGIGANTTTTTTNRGIGANTTTTTTNRVIGANTTTTTTNRGIGANTTTTNRVSVCKGVCPGLVLVSKAACVWSHDSERLSICTFLSVDTGIRQEICSRILWDNCMHGACVGVGI